MSLYNGGNVVDGEGQGEGLAEIYANVDEEMEASSRIVLGEGGDVFFLWQENGKG